MHAGLSRVEKGIIAGAFVAATGFLVSLLITASHWMALGPLVVYPARAGLPVAMQYDRTFFRNFPGEWLVQVWRVEPTGRFAWCSASDQWRYEAGTHRGDIDLAWLTNGQPRCETLPPGFYQVAVSITANPGTLISRTGEVSSNVFEVTP